MSNLVLLKANDKLLEKEINDAKHSVYLAMPGVNSIIADALIAASKRLGEWNNIKIIIDPSPNIFYQGYAEYDAFKRLIDNNCPILSEKNLRIGILIVDDRAIAFSPISLAIESEEVVKNMVNAIELTISPENYEDVDRLQPNMPKKAPIGARKISEAEIEIIENIIAKTPPKNPFALRQTVLLSRKFQFIKLSFKGAQIRNSKISLNSKELGVTDPDLRNRITGQFKVFDKLPDVYKAELTEYKSKFEKIKQEYTRSLGEYGAIVFQSQNRELSEALKSLNIELSKFNKNMAEIIMNEINSSKTKIKTYVAENYNKISQSSPKETFENLNNNGIKNVNQIIDKAFEIYTIESLKNNLEIKFHFYNISPQLIEDKNFIQKIEQVTQRTIEDLISYE